jgi:hypothetical protein
MAAKAENPEAKLQQAVGREIEIRLMQDFMNKQVLIATAALQISRTDQYSE